MLPDLDENVSFVVDKGSPVGPIQMRSIIDSIRSGDRAPDVLVWWAGAKDWVAFSNDSDLLDLLQELPATNQPPPPPDVEEPDVGEPDVAEPDVGEIAGADVDETENRFPEPEVRTFDVSFVDGEPAGSSGEVSDPGDFEDAASELAQAESELQRAELDLDEVLEGYPVQLDDESVGPADSADADEDAAVEASVEELDPSEPFFDPVAEAEADALLARGPRSMHPSASWGDDETTVIDRDVVGDDRGAGDDVADQEVVAEAPAEQRDESVLSTRAIDIEGFQRVLADQGSLETSAIDPSMLDELVNDDTEAEANTETDDAHETSPDIAASEESEIEEPEVLPQSGLTGLFGSPSRAGTDAEDFDAAEPVIASGPAPTSALETVGARIDALTSATRRAQQGGAMAIDEAEQQVESDVADGTRARDDGDEAEGDVLADATDTDEDTENEQSSGSWQVVEGGPDLEDRFSEMVRLSVAHQRRLEWELRPDELLLTSCITAIGERGYVLLDLENQEASQRAVFDHHDDSRHIRLELSPLSPVNAAGDPIGRHVQVSVAWGREVEDADAAFATVRAGATDELTEPGTISCEANMVASSATTSVELIWAAQDFVRDDHSVDRAALDASIIAILQALEARWHELFTAA